MGNLFPLTLDVVAMLLLLLWRCQGAKEMKYRSRNLLCAVVLLAGLTLPVCHRNPQVAKQKYFDKGAQYFQQGKYNEAAIEFQNALQIDSNFADAHYQLALCYLKR